MKTIVSFLLLAPLGACTGFIIDGAGTEGRAAEGGDPPGPAPMLDPERPPPECDGLCLGATPLTRLTRDAYLHSVESAFGVPIDLNPALLPPDAVAGSHFSSNAGARYVESTATGYLAVAERLAETLAPTVRLSCDAATDPDSCGRWIFDTYAPVLFRREIDPEWAIPYGALYAATFADEGSEAALEVTLSTLLQSPYFLYRVEPIAGDDAARLRGEALASRLSLLLWRDGPDAELRRAAAAGDLDTPEGLSAQAERLLGDPRAERGLSRFHEEWLGLDALEVPDELADALRRETSSFVVDAFTSNGDARSLFTSGTANVDATLAEHYGVASGDDVSVPGRVGLLTHGSVLAAHGGPGISRPIMRGAFIVTDAICNDVGRPPADVNLAEVADMAEALGPDATTREKVESVTGSGACAGCHSVLNPPGFAFEAFDVDGRFIPSSADTAGEMRTPAGDVAFADHAELLEGLLDNRAIQACYTVQWFRYALGRADTADDARALWEIHEAFEASGYALPELLKQIVKSDPFTHRRAPEPEGAAGCE